MLELRDGIRKSDKQFNYSFEFASNQPTCWLVLCWSTFGAKTSHGRLRIHKIHHGSDSGEAITFPHIVYSAPLREGYIPKLLRLEFPRLCKLITSCLDLRSGRGPKQSCSSRRELFNGVLHATCTHRGRVDSRHFVVGNQIASLTPDFSFCHNLCYKCPNGSYELILGIYTSIAFQWYKEFLNARCFDFCNRFLKVWESTRNSTPKMGVHLGMWVFILTLSHTPFGPCPWQAFALVASPRLKLRHNS